MSTLENSITKFVQNLLTEKLVGKKFITYKSFDSVTFSDAGTHRIDFVNFMFQDEIDRYGSDRHYEVTIPSYKLFVTGVAFLEDGEKPFARYISITDLP